MYGSLRLCRSFVGREEAGDQYWHSEGRVEALRRLVVEVLTAMLLQRTRKWDCFGMRRSAPQTRANLKRVSTKRLERRRIPFHLDL